MAFHRARTWAIAGLGLGALGMGTTGCPGDDSGGMNVLPTASASDTGTNASTGDASTGTPPDGSDTASVDTTMGGGGSTLPATYRFDCVDVIEMGDSDGDGQPDGNAIQASLLETNWSSDVDNFKLNIMLTVRDRDEAAGTATVVIGSGIGTGNNDLCTEPTTASSEYPAGFDAAAAQWQPADGDACSDVAGGGEFGGTYSFELGASDTIYIYAQDDDGTTFNCVPGGGSPDAVPVHAISATVTASADESVAAGQLTGCLVDSEAQNLCSCLGSCVGGANPDCGGCPDGAVPLATLLGGVMPTDNCTSIMGETAYDLTIGFTTRRLGTPEPMQCSG